MKEKQREKLGRMVRTEAKRIKRDLYTKLTSLEIRSGNKIPRSEAADPSILLMAQRRISNI